MENFEIERILRTVNSKKVYIVLIILLTVTIGYIYSYYFVTPMYKASTTIILAKDSDEEQSSNDAETITQSDINLNQKLVSTYSQIIKSDKVVNTVIQNLDLDMTESELQSNITVQAVNETEILKISVTNDKPGLTASIANELVKVFEQEVTSIYNINNVSVIDEAKVPTGPYNINHAKDVVMAFIIGIVISAGLIFVLYLFDTTIKIEEDIEQYVGLNVLATIPLYTKKLKNNSKKEQFEELITYEDAKSPVSESFRTLRTNLVFGQEKDSLKTILITSSYTSEGKSWVSSNMAVTFAQTNKKVLIIDCDMRKGRQHHIFNVQSRPGLSNCLTKLDEFKSISDISEYIRETNIPNLHIMTGGDRPSNPSELISSKRMDALLHIMNQMYDIVVLDGTPSTIVSDSVILSRIADATILVTACKETKIKNVQKIKKLIENADGKIVGAIINKMPVSQREYQNKYYYSDRGEKINLKQIEDNETPTATVEQLLTRLNANMEQSQTLIDSVVVKEKPGAKKKTKIDKSLFGDNLSEPAVPSYDNVDAIQYKIESINNEIDTIKDIFAQILINSQNQLKDNAENKIQTHTLKDKLEDLKLICRNIQEVQNTNTLQRTAEEIKSEIEEISIACANLDIKDAQTKELINQQLQKMQENYSSMLDEKLSSIKDTDSTEEIKQKLVDLQKFVSVTVTENNNGKELEELKEKLEDIENVYKSYEHRLDEKLYKMQKNIIEATKEQRLEKFRDRINSVKEVYSKELEVKLRALEERLIDSNNTKNIEEKIDEIKLMYTDKLEQNLSNVENLLLQTTKAEDVQQLENKLNQIQQMYTDRLEQNLSNIENILLQTTKSEEIHQLEDKTEQMKQAYLEQLNLKFQNMEDIFAQNNRLENIQNIEANLEQFKNTHSTQIENIQQDVQKIIEHTTKTEDLKEFKDSIQNIQETYKEELNEKLNNLENILEKYNNSENINEIKQEVQMLKNIYSQELEQKISSLQQMIDQNAKTEELQKMQQEMQYLKDTYNQKIRAEEQLSKQLEEEMNYLKDEMYGLKLELHKQNKNNSRNIASQPESKKLIKIEEIKAETSDDPYMIRLNNMKAEMEMHRQYKNMLNDSSSRLTKQDRRERRKSFWGRQEDNSLFAVKQSFMEDIEQAEPRKTANSVSQILNFNNDSQVV